MSSVIVVTVNISPRSHVEQDLSAVRADLSDRQNSWNVERVEITKERDMLSQQLGNLQVEVSNLKEELSQVGVDVGEEREG